MSENTSSILEDIRVLDLTEDRGLYSGKLLADLGADVIKVENPKGSRARKIGPYKGDVPGLENSLYFVNFNTNKRGITLNLDHSAGKEIFKRLAQRADVVVEDFEPGKMKSLGFDYPVLKEINRRLIMASVTGFGQTGPYSRFQAPDVVNFAVGGLMFQSGAREEPPVVAPCEQSYHSASTMSVFGILAALLLRMRTQEGQQVDICSHEVLAYFSQGIMRYSIATMVGGRSGSQFGTAPARIYPCKDGFVHFLVFYANHWRSFLEILGNPDMFMDKAWYESSFRIKNVDLIDNLVMDFTKDRTKDEIVQLCQSKGVPCTPVNTPADVSRDPHFRERGFFINLEHPVIGRYTYLRSPFCYSEAPGTIKRPAPLLGQHNREIYRELSYQDEELLQFKTDGII